MDIEFVLRSKQICDLRDYVRHFKSSYKQEAKTSFSGLIVIQTPLRYLYSLYALTRWAMKPQLRACHASHTFQLSRILRETHAFEVFYTLSRIATIISRIFPFFFVKYERTQLYFNVRTHEVISIVLRFPPHLKHGERFCSITFSFKSSQVCNIRVQSNS